MIQQVNLLVEGLRPAKASLDFKQTTFGLAFVFGILVLTASHKGWQLVDLQARTEALRSQVTALRSTFTRASSAADLQSRLDQLIQERDLVRAQVETLRGAQRLSGFSGEIRMLSESAVAGLWLTDFSIFRSPSGEPIVNLSGRTFEPSTVANYVNELKAHGGLAGYTFANIEVVRGESEATFVLNGEMRDDDALVN